MKLLIKVKSPILLGILLLFSLSLSAEFVSSDQALLVAQNWLRYWQPERSPQVDEIHVYQDARLSALDPARDALVSEEAELYLVYFVDNAWTLVPADDNLRPILAYSSLPLSDKSDLPPAFKLHLDFYANDVRYARETKLELADNKIMWSEIQNGSFNRFRSERAVSPLLATTWNQDFPYNELCPPDAAGPGGYVYAGCVATAMGQVMKYWNSPVQGTGSNTYYASGYGYQSANFGATTYLWDEMPNSLGFSNIPVATLLYHAAVGVNMSFSPDGSGSNGIRARSALQSYFSYPNATYAQKQNYSNTNWENLLKGQLDNGVPMYYSGSGTDVGHAWNCDGYQGDNYFHFNLGWGGSYNGYYYLNSIVAGSNTLTYNQAAIINTIPAYYTISQPRIRLQAQNSMAGDPFQLNINTYPVLSDWNVTTYGLSIFYEQNAMQFLGADLAGTISEGGDLTIDSSVPGYLTISWNRAQPLFGGGNLLKLNFHSREPGDFLFIPVDMHYNSNVLANVEELMVTIGSAVPNLAASTITLSNAMHVAYNSLATINVNTSYLPPSWNVTHYEFDLNFDPEKVQFHDLVIAETLSAGASDIQTELVSPGLLHVSCTTDSPISGQTSLLAKIRFLAIGNGSSNVATVVSMSNFMYNDTPIASTPNGIIVLSPVTSVDEQFPLASLQVQNYPNPFNPSTTIKLDIPKKGPVNAAIYNLKGQLVYTLQDGILSEGQHSFVWQGTDQAGKPQSNGIYLLKVQSPSGNRISKLTMMK